MSRLSLPVDIDARIAALEANLHELEARAVAVRAALDAYRRARDAEAALAGEGMGASPVGTPTGGAPPARRTIADVAYDALRAAGQPLGLTDLLGRIEEWGWPTRTGDHRAALVVALSRECKRHDARIRSVRRGVYEAVDGPAPNAPQ